jgi:acyl carrier protein
LLIEWEYDATRPDASRRERGDYTVKLRMKTNKERKKMLEALGDIVRVKAPPAEAPAGLLAAAIKWLKDNHNEKINETWTWKQLRESGLDSLDQVELLIEVEEQCNRRIDDEWLAGLERNPTVTLREMADTLFADAKRRYANARKRARFWSGNPSWSNFGPTGKNLTTCRMDEKYELAMYDCHSWEDRIGQLTGKELKHYDPKQEFRSRFARMMSKSANAPGDPRAQTTKNV